MRSILQLAIDASFPILAEVYVQKRKSRGQAGCGGQLGSGGRQRHAKGLLRSVSHQQRGEGGVGGV